MHKNRQMGTQLLMKVAQKHLPDHTGVPGVGQVCIGCSHCVSSCRPELKPIEKETEVTLR